MTFKHYIHTYLMLSEDGANGMGCGTAAYKKTSRGGGLSNMRVELVAYTTYDFASF